MRGRVGAEWRVEFARLCALRPALAEEVDGLVLGSRRGRVVDLAERLMVLADGEHGEDARVVLGRLAEIARQGL
ncbi:hypothetical protein BMS3Bbin13_00008 [bacterium BMS3Bbin13]|nr:hypothetical protein BMS3Bbin13_00008 [bacterium BMS3Bbin13]